MHATCIFISITLEILLVVQFTLCEIIIYYPITETRFGEDYDVRNCSLRNSSCSPKILINILVARTIEIVCLSEC
jgi:hypothetical protein